VVRYSISNMRFTFALVLMMAFSVGKEVSVLDDIIYPT
jgi:hypothetical protein